LDLFFGLPIDDIFFRFFASFVLDCFGLYAKTTSAIASSAFGTFSGVFVIE
jgi:hypothetical protein